MRRWLLVALVTLLGVACDPSALVGGEPAEEARWGVAPGATLTPETRQVPILVNEVACNSGQDATGRISTRIEYGENAIVVTALVRPRGGDQNCPSNPNTPYLLVLDEPLGNRELLNGATDEIARRPLEQQD